MTKLEENTIAVFERKILRSILGRCESEQYLEKKI
jgi:hypothetical protein